MQYQKFLSQTLIQAADIAIKNFGRAKASIKAGDTNQVVTTADTAIGQFIISQIKIHYPNHNIIDEEAGVIDNHSDFTWVVDPIDGTSNFAASLPTYCIMIGLLKDKTPIVSGISLPAANQIFLAEKNKGAYCNQERLRVTQESKLINSLISYAIDSHRENPELTRAEGRLLAEIVLNIRSLRTNGSCYDALLVAQGKLGAWLTQTSKIWDNVSPQLIVEEAGGLYTDFFGRPMDYSNPLAKAKNNFTFCAAAPALHQQLQQIIQKHFQIHD